MENNIKKYIIFSVLFIVSVFNPNFVSAENSKMAEEELQGASVWQNLQNKETSCDKLSNDDFEKLGDYFMGQMAGSSHSAMDARMEQMMGESQVEQMHIVLGKRMSGCDTSAQFTNQGQGFMPMMPMM